MTDNDIGYLVYRWEQSGYNFSPLPKEAKKSWASYSKYYTDENENKLLIKTVLELFKDEIKGV